MAESDAGSHSSAGDVKSGMASLMRRAVQQAKAEAAAGSGQDAVAIDSGQTADSQKAPEAAASERKALAARLQQAAHTMGEVEAGSAAEPVADPHNSQPKQADSADALIDDQPQQSDLQDDPLDPDQLQLSRLSLSQSSTSSSEADSPLAKARSLGQRLGSMMKNALSPSRQSSYIPLDADSSPEAEQTNDSPTARRRDLPHDTSLGQRLGSILKGALSLPKQSSYIPLSGDEAVYAIDMSDRPAIPRELSLRERYGSMSLSREPSSSFPTDNHLLGCGAASDSSVLLSPGKRRALPRDASYLPEWVTRSHRQTASARGDGSASPRSRLGSSVSSASDDSAVPRWVDWPRTSPQAHPQQPEQQGGDELAPVAPILMAPPHLRKQQLEAQKADVALPRAKRPLAFAPTPLSLSLLHTPSMNPQMDLRLDTPVATPKGQRLFDFWHQKSEQPAAAAAAAPATQPKAEPSVAAHTSQHTNLVQLAFPTTSRQSGVITASSLPQLPGAIQNANQASSLASEHTPTAVHAQQAADAGVGPVQSGTAPSALVAELEIASGLVHKQSLQQAELLEGLERALSQLSEHRLLVQNPQAAAMSNQEDASQSEGMLHHVALLPALRDASVASCSRACCGQFAPTT